MLRESIPVAEAAARMPLLEELVDAVATAGRSGDDPVRAEAARAAVIDQLGPEWLVDASAVIANFEMMTRLADGTGARLVPERLAASVELRAERGIDDFPSARF